MKGEIVADSNSDAEIGGTYTGTAKTEGMFLLEEGTFIKAKRRADEASTVAPYSAYVKALDPSIATHQLLGGHEYGC